MKKQNKKVPRRTVALVYLILLALIAFAGYCVFQTQMFLFPYS